MSKAKFEAARELIEQKQYAEARAILKTIDHPQATKWLARLDQLAPERKMPTTALYAGGAVITLIAIILLLVIASRLLQPQPTTTALAALATYTPTTESGPAMTLTAIEQSIQIEVYAELSTYCQTVAGRSQGDCRRWADTITAANYAGASLCHSEYDWIYDTNKYSLCLLTQGIAVLGSSPTITPLDATIMDDHDLAITGALIAHCQNDNEEDYCYVWSVIAFMQNSAALLQCPSPEDQIMEFFGCVERLSIAL